MARLISVEELMNAEESTGWMETFYEENEEVKEHFALEAIAYNCTGYAVLGGSGCFDGYFDIYNVRTDCGYRIWDSKPTAEEMKNTAWEEQK